MHHSTDKKVPDDIDLPGELLNDDNHPEPIKLPQGFPAIAVSSSPYFSMYRLVRHLKPRRILEIGTQIGVSALTMALACRDNGITPDITCIDPFMKSFDNNGLDFLMDWYRTMNDSRQKPGVHLFMCMSSLVLPRLNTLFDFAFIDGSHSYRQVKEDCILTIDHLADGGYFVVHDYIIYDDVSKAVDEVAAEFNAPCFINNIQRNNRGELCGWAILRKTGKTIINKAVIDKISVQADKSVDDQLAQMEERYRRDQTRKQMVIKRIFRRLKSMFGILS